MKNHRCIVLAVMLALAGATEAFAQDQGSGFFLQLGVGPGRPFYPPYLEDGLAGVAADPLVDRVQLSLDLALGMRTAPGRWLVLRVDGVGDRLFDAYDYYQINVYLYSAGFRWYPSLTGAYVELGAGASRMVVQDSVYGTEASAFSYGAGAAVGWDFNQDGRGTSLSLELKYDWLDIEGEPVGALLATVNLAFR